MVDSVECYYEICGYHPRGVGKFKDLGGHVLSTGEIIATSEEPNVSILSVKRSSILEQLDSDNGDSKRVSKLHHAFTEIK